VHEEDSPRNSQIAKTKGVIYLGPSGNLRGGFKFMDLNSGKKIVRCSWDVIPMPDLVIYRVKALGRDQPQNTTFTDRHGRLIGDVEIPGVDDQEEDDDHLPGEVPVIEDDIEITGVDVEGTETQDAIPAPQVEIDDLDIHHADPAPIEVQELKRLHLSHYRHRNLSSVDQQESGHRLIRDTHQVCQDTSIHIQ
jgi:hypothetical protein